MNYKLNGTAFLRTYMQSNGIDENVTRQRIASAMNVPIIHMRTEGQTAASFERTISEAQAQSLADLLGTTVANLKADANGPILIQLP